MGDMNKTSVHQITKHFGADVIAATFGVTEHSVRYARTAGVFPASWYDALSIMCLEAGIACPRNAFNWKPVAKKTGYDVDARQLSERSGFENNPAPEIQQSGEQ